MTIHATFNPIGSTNPKDLIDNAQNLDLLSLGPNASYPDRLSVQRKSWKGMEGEFDAAQLARASEYTADKSYRDTTFSTDQAYRVTQFNAFLASSGYETPVAYAAGLSITRSTQIVLQAGELYRPKVASLPFTTTTFAADSAKWIANGDNSLRQDIANAVDLLKGAGMLGYRAGGTGAVGRTVAAKLDGWVNVEDYGAVGDGTFNDTAFIQAAIDAAGTKRSVIFDPDKTYSVDSLTLKPGGVYIGRLWVGGDDHTLSLPRIKYRGTTGNVFSLGTPGGSPVRGAVFQGLAVDGNGTTGAVLSWAAHRGKIAGNAIKNGKDLILFQETTSWAGENRVEGNQLSGFTDAIRSIGIYAIDGFIDANTIFSGVRGVVLAEMAGWNITRNHTYGISGAHFDITGALCKVVNNYCDNIQSVGILVTVSTAVSGSIVSQNTITGVTTPNVIGIHVVCNNTGKVMVSDNPVYFVTALAGTTGIKTSGGSTFFGSILHNQIDQADTPYDLHSAPNTDFVEARSNRLLINGLELRFGHNGNAAWQNSLMSITSAPEGSIVANAGTLALRTSGGAAGSGELYLKISGAGNTGWRKVPGGVTNLSDSTATDVAGLKADFNTLLARLRTSGILV